MNDEQRKPQFLYFNRKGEIVEFSLFIDNDIENKKNGVISAPSGAGMSFQNHNYRRNIGREGESIHDN